MLRAGMVSLVALAAGSAFALVLGLLLALRRIVRSADWEPW
jgi:hypothetical protein